MVPMSDAFNRPLFLLSRSDDVVTGTVPFEGSTLADMTFEFWLKAQQFNIPDDVLQQMLQMLQREDVVVDLSDRALEWKGTFLYRFGMVGLVCGCAPPGAVIHDFAASPIAKMISKHNILTST